MRILFVSHDDGKYGAALSLRKLITLLRDEHDIEPIVITRRSNELNEYCTQMNIENYTVRYVNAITYLDQHPIFSLFHSMLQSLKNMFMHYYAEIQLRRMLDLRTVDAVYTNVGTIDFGAWLAHKYNKPHFWHVREFLDRDLKARPASRNYFPLMNNSVAVIAISNVIRDAWISKGIRPEIIHTIYNGIDANMNNLDKVIPAFDGKRTLEIVFTGSAAPHKGVKDLVDAIAKLIKTTLKIHVTIFGEFSTPYGVKVQQRVEELNLSEFITFRGFSTNVQSELPKFDVGVVCSKAEAFGRVTVEYMLSGLAVISTDGGANLEVVSKGKTGLTYSFGNADELANRILELHRSPELVKRLGKNGRQRAIEKFSATENANNINQLITTTIEGVK